MSKLRVKKSDRKASAKREELAAAVEDTATKPIAPESVDIEAGDTRYLVRLMDGRKQNPLGAMINADSKSEAREKFLNLCGIRGTEHPIRVEEDVDESDFTLSEVGIITKGLV